MPAYQVAVCKITARTPGLMEYVEKSAKLLAQHGAKYIVRGPADTVLEGEGLKGMAVIVTEWPSLEALKAFYHSPEYQAAKALRANTGIYEIAAFPGAGA